MTNNRQKNIERAIVFLVDYFQKTGNNPKPVILHSIKVGLMLDNLSYSDDVVCAGILHDILEDTAVTNLKLREEFGEKVARLVEANTFNKNITDKKSNYEELFQRCLKNGKEAIAIKAADIYQNSFYYHFAKKDEYTILLEKMSYFIRISKNLLQRDKIFHLLEGRYAELAKEGIL